MYSEIRKFIEKKLGRNLMSMILFGSKIRGFKGRDLDIIVIARNLPSSLKSVRCMEKELESYLFRSTKQVCDIHLFTKKSFEENLTEGTFLVGLTLGYRIIVDKAKVGNRIENFLKTLRGKDITYVDRYGEWKIGKIARILSFRSLRKS
jgi:predicted nucleotidyltransferase